MEGEFPNLSFTDDAKEDLKKAKSNPSLKAQYKSVSKALKYMSNGDLRHRSLQTHEYTDMKGENGEKVWEPMHRIILLEHIEFFSIMVLKKVRLQLSQ